MAENVPEMAENVPEMAENVPEMTENVPEMYFSRFMPFVQGCSKLKVMWDENRRTPSYRPNCWTDLNQIWCVDSRVEIPEAAA